MPFDPSTAVLDEQPKPTTFDPSTAVLDESPTVNKRRDIVNSMAGISPEETGKAGIDAFVAGDEKTANRLFLSSAIQGAGKDILSMPAHFFNQFLLNYPRSGLRKAGYDYPEAENKIINAASKVSGIAGGIKNPLLKALGPTRTTGQIARTGAITGALYAPTEDIVGLKERATQATLGGITPYAFRGLGVAGRKTGEAIPKALRSSSARVVNSLVKPLLKDFSYGKNPGLVVAQEGIVANNLDDLAQKIGQRRQEYGSRIGALLDNNNSKVNVEAVLQPIDTAIDEAAKINNQSLINRLIENRNAIVRKLVADTDEGGNKVIKTLGDRDLKSMKVSEAHNLKMLIGSMTKWTGNPSDDAITNKALKQSYGKLKEIINDAVPEVKLLNEKYANLQSAEIATVYRNKIESRQALIGLAPRIVGYGGAMAGIATGNPALVIASLTEMGVDKALKSPTVKTRLARTLYKMSEADLGKVLNRFPQLTGLVQKTGRNIGNIARYVYDEPVFSGSTVGAGKEFSQGVGNVMGSKRGSVSIPFAERIDMPVNLPKSNDFAEAVKNTPGASITPQGLTIDTLRYQHPNQAGERSLRTGVFYLPDKTAPQKKYYSTGRIGYGGTEKIEGKTLLKNPLFVKAGTGGRGPQIAYDTINGKGAYKKMRSDVLKNSWQGLGMNPDENAISRLLEKYGGDPDYAWEIIQNSKKGNTLAYAIQEHIVANSVRNSGFDGVLSYSTKKDGSKFLSELFDVREIAYPTTDGDFSVHEKFKLKQ